MIQQPKPQGEMVKVAKIEAPHTALRYHEDSYREHAQDATQ
jgi:hypothetical protein